MFLMIFMLLGYGDLVIVVVFVVSEVMSLLFVIKLFFVLF